MNTSNPKYITYKGAKYQKIDTLSEIVVDPLPRRCCVVIVNINRHIVSFGEGKFVNSPPASIPDIVRQEGLETSHDPEEFDEFFSVKQLDEFTYCGSYGEEGLYMVCTRNRGVGSNIYNLFEQYSKEESYELGKEIADGVLTVINNVVGHNWDF
jgi:hypothetical protein